MSTTRQGDLCPVKSRPACRGCSLLDAGNYVWTIEERQGLKIGVPEEAAWRCGFIGDDRLRERGELLIKSGYGAYLLGLLDGWEGLEAFDTPTVRHRSEPGEQVVADSA